MVGFMYVTTNWGGRVGWGGVGWVHVSPYEPSLSGLASKCPRIAHVGQGSVEATSHGFLIGGFQKGN